MSNYNQKIALVGLTPVAVPVALVPGTTIPVPGVVKPASKSNDIEAEIAGANCKDVGPIGPP